MSDTKLTSNGEPDLVDRLSQIMPTRLTHFWAGQWQPAPGAEVLEAINPSTGERLASLPVAQAEQVDAAVRAADDAFPAWSRTPPLERASMLRRAAVLIREHAADLALIDAAGCGNPVKAMLFDAEIAATQLEYFAGLVLEIKGETLPTGNGSLNYTKREPLGVVARIFPFNHPFMFAAGKIAAPLAAGNTVVMKPPEQAPLSTLRLVELLAEVFPPGVLNCVLGGRDTGAALVAHPKVAAIGLIGSVPAGRAVLAAAAHDMKHTLLELGGKNAMIVYPDADFDKAVAGAVRGMNFTWCGQSCGSTSRLFLHESIHDRFVQALITRVAIEHRPGIATDPATTMGALASEAQYRRSLEYIKIALQEGANLACGGKHPEDPTLKQGYFIEPTVFTEVRPDMRIAQEEVFGPVLSVLKWSDEDELLCAVNGVDFGLTTSIWTRDLVTAHSTADRVQAGYIWINDCSSHFIGAPFGGYKRSGKGREESRDELFEFTQIKNINVSMAR
ncbi:aldehyde dehydrogenase family protein [Pusillimonas noertemannii]|uniref:Betaine-aldehyde dehydrogenase n=1 Tax=Pusillimonas noertemannii TaxID=305977 RepID=A0A2U1CSZ0_9BURK|nr:aldehyde dehydrogenase family protein [Pusillimonas noertemannii]NYT70545.1 aldehyde dehydrogenase family protein [Pusillimonas noertemannii]PVY68944.1 betaine-aldehyde dehydrogenase [Pusillimonas noertemannii]TFL11611.1 aldehyde dehydrogenase family protein [Pusillimonas noertemannii]